MKRTENMPSLVYWGLWGIRSRAVAVGFLMLSLLLTLLVVYVSVMLNNYKYLIFVLAPLWYWYAIKWVDKNASWNSQDNSYKN